MPRLTLLATFALFLFLGCATTAPAPAPPPAVPPDEPAPAAWGLTAEEEAAVLRLEDRREFAAEMAASWIAHPNAAHRRRMVVALGRIGPATFVDTSGNGVRDDGERMAGVDLLSTLISDPAHEVREAAAFALGEIGDPAALDPLFELAIDPEHAGVAAEAIEAISKLAPHVSLDRYAAWTGATVPEGVRARAIRFLFRFEDARAAELAATYLSDGSTYIRREAAYSLSRKPAASARERLQLLLTDPDILTRAFAARALGRIGEEPSTLPLLDSLDDDHPWVRTNALLSLAQIAEASGAALAGEGVEESMRILTATRDADPGTRVSAIEPLGYLARSSEPARARLLEMAADGTSWEREVATAAFIRHFGTAEPSTVDSLLSTDSRFMKIRAIEAAAAGNAPDIQMRFLSDPDASVRAAALGGTPDALVETRREAILAALDDPDPIVRASAIDRFAALPSLAPAEKLTRLSELAARWETDSLDDARIAAIQAIAALEGTEKLAVLEPLVRDADPVVRRLAAEALAASGQPRPQYTPLPVERPAEEYLQIARWALQPHTVTLDTSRGSVKITLLARDAPMTAWNFAQLARSDYFDGTTFMRVVPNFVVQTGDPRNDQSGGPGYSIRDEINLQKYTRGAVGMALSGPDTGGSQYFITHSPQPHLDGGYTIFGRVIDGMSGVVDQIQRGDVVSDIRIHDEEVPDVEASISAVEKPPLPLEVGPTSPDRLLAFIPEYPERKQSYAPDPAVVEALAAMIQPGDSMEVFLGTWCSDSQREVPKLLTILDLLGENYDLSVPVAYIGVDRAKQEPAELLAGRSIEKVSTFIYYRDGEETGRIEERPEGLFEDHFLRLVAPE